MAFGRRVGIPRLLGASWTRLEAHIMVDVLVPPQRGRLFGMSGRSCATSDHEDTGKAIHIAAMHLVDVSREQISEKFTEAMHIAVRENSGQRSV